MVERVEKLFQASIALSSFKVYRRAWNLFNQAFTNMGLVFNGSIDLPLSPDQIILFVGYLSNAGFASASITSYTSAIGYIHKLLNMPDPTSQFLVQKLLSACNKVNNSVDTRLPITIVVLQRLVCALDHTVPNLYLRQLFKAMYSVAFFGLMRLGEITQDSNKQVPLTIDQIQFTSSSVLLSIRKFKHNLSLKPVQLVLPAQKDKSICPVNQLKKYLKLRGNSPGPLFRYIDGVPISRKFFTVNLKSALQFCDLNTDLYKSHSFRIGSASYYAKNGFSDSQIRIMGRWSSNAFLKYIRTDRLVVSLQCSTDPSLSV